MDLNRMALIDAVTLREWIACFSSMIYGSSEGNIAHCDSTSSIRLVGENLSEVFRERIYVYILNRQGMAMRSVEFSTALGGA